MEQRGLRRKAWRGAIAALVLAALPGGLFAGSFRVMPVRIVLDRDEPVSAMSIRNDADEPARVQLRVVAWRQDNGEDVFEPTHDILANPPLFEMAARSGQTARIGLRVPPGAKEKSYRVFIDEIPPAAAPRPGEVRTLLRISIPLFVPPVRLSSRLEWHARMAADGIVVTLRNAGNAHVQVNRLSIVAAGGKVIATQDLSAYLLPGTTRDLPVRITAPIGANRNIVVEAMTDQGNVRSELVVEARSGAGVVG